MDKSLIQGSMMMLILKLLEEKDMYGYEMIDTLHHRSNKTFELKAGSLYPLLHSLETKSYVNSYEDDSTGKKRKYYHITREGKKCLKNKEQEWNEYQHAVVSVMSYGKGVLV